MLKTLVVAPHRDNRYGNLRLRKRFGRQANSAELRVDRPLNAWSRNVGFALATFQISHMVSVKVFRTNQNRTRFDPRY
jgi:hypothetical protein